MARKFFRHIDDGGGRTLDSVPHKKKKFYVDLIYISAYYVILKCKESTLENLQKVPNILLLQCAPSTLENGKLGYLLVVSQMKQLMF